MDKRPTYIHPKNFADHLSYQQDYYLFLDIDGTLAHFTLNPKHSFIPDSTLSLLQKIQNHGVRIAVVTGRSLAEARQMLSPLSVPIAATHGLEIAFDDRDDSEVIVAPVDTLELAAIRQAIIQSCTPFNDFTIEDKPYSVALHFRQDPSLADIAYTIMAETLKDYPNWALKPGKFVWETVPRGVNKGTAILNLLEKMPTDDPICPIFIGDDMTDEAGFMAVQGENKLNNHYPSEQGSVKGLGIKVGSEPTCAHYYVKNIHEVSMLLTSFLAFCQENTILTTH